jgi:uncharacterized protein
MRVPVLKNQHSPALIRSFALLLALAWLPVAPAGAQSTAAVLLDVARSGDLQALEAQVRQGVDVNAAAGDGTTALHHVVRRNEADAVELLLRAGADPNATTDLSITPLLLASGNGNSTIMRLLLANGADLVVRDHAGETLLMAAARAGDAAAITLLVELGADLEAGDSPYEQTALMLAARTGNDAAVAALLQAGANHMAMTRVGPEPRFGPNGGTRGEGVEKAPARGMRQAIPGGKTALMYAAREGHLGSVRLLLDAGANIDAADPNGITPLIFAASNDRMEVAQFLVERGANIQTLDWYGRSALWAAIDVRNMDTPNPPLGNGIDRARVLRFITLLLERGADPNSRIVEMPVVRRHVLPLGSLSWVDFTGETPFIRAALAGDVAVMRLLLKHGADPLLATSGGTTSLMAAAGVNWVVSQTWDEGPAALLEAVQICLDAGVDVNAANTMGVRAIHGAANRGSDNIIRLLAEHGADLTALDGNGRSAQDWAQGVFLATHPPIPKPDTLTLLHQLIGSP